MLNRTEILKELLMIRRIIYKKELKMNNGPTDDDNKIKKDMDRLILEIIGDFLSKEDEEQLNKILLKSVCGEISIDIALIAIREIVAAYFNKNKSRYNYDKSGNNGVESNYNVKKNNNRHKTFRQEEYR
ncbi:MAG: hypothetical protein ACOCRK_08975 [bacterium]